MSHFESLLPQAAEVRDATLEGENTAIRIGTLFVDLLQALAAALPTKAIDASSIKQKMEDDGLTISFDVVSDTGSVAQSAITVPIVSEASAGLITPELIKTIANQLSSIAEIASRASSDAASTIKKLSILETTVENLDASSETLRSNVETLSQSVSEISEGVSSLADSVSGIESSTETLRSSVKTLSDSNKLIDGRLSKLEQINIVPLVYFTLYLRMESSADLQARLRTDLPGLQLIKSSSGGSDFLVLVKEDGSYIINPRPFCKKEGFGVAEFDSRYFYRYTNILFKVKDKNRIVIVFLPTSDTEKSISELAERMNRLEEQSGGDGSVEFDGATLAAINTALNTAYTAQSRALEALEAASEAQEAVASVSLMAEHVAPYLKYHALPVTAVRPEGCFDSDGPGIYLVPANDKYEWANFEFGQINGVSGAPWHAYLDSESAHSWESHWAAVKTALSLPYYLNLMDFGTVEDADGVMDAKDGLYFSIEDQCYYRVSADGSLCEPMLFQSDIEVFTDEDIDAAVQNALDFVNS